MTKGCGQYLCMYKAGYESKTGEKVPAMEWLVPAPPKMSVQVWPRAADGDYYPPVYVHKDSKGKWAGTVDGTGVTVVHGDRKKDVLEQLSALYISLQNNPQELARYRRLVGAAKQKHDVLLAVGAVGECNAVPRKIGGD